MIWNHIQKLQALESLHVIVSRPSQCIVQCRDVRFTKRRRLFSAPLTNSTEKIGTTKENQSSISV